MKIAVYTIALNEAAHAERWANSAIDADYRIVGDTGSTDGTVERLTSLGVTVHRIAVRPWRFDDARNAVLSLIPADVDVCLSMDMDEYLSPGWRPIIEASWKPETNCGWCQKAARYNVADPAPYNSFSVRNFHQRWGYRFRRPVHEVLHFTGENEISVGCPEIIINHVQDHGKTTRQQYLPLMELAHKEAPEDAQICFWLGREYMWANQGEKAAAMFERYLALPASTWPDERSEAMRYLARVVPERKMFWLDRARIEAPHRREIWADLAEELHGQADWLNLFWACVNGVEKTRRTGTYLDDPSCWGFRLFDLASIAAWHLGMLDRAVGWAEKALELAPEHQRARVKTNRDYFIGLKASAKSPISHDKIANVV